VTPYLQTHHLRVSLGGRGGKTPIVPLALVEVAVAVALLVAISLGEAVVLLILLVSPLCHHVM
jgi:hypothetical protein